MAGESQDFAEARSGSAEAASSCQGEAPIEHRASFTEYFLSACRLLGRVRVVLRDPAGTTQGVADLGDLRICPRCAHVESGEFRLHLAPKVLRAMRLNVRPAKGGGVTRAVWLYAQSSQPVVLFILDQPSGADALAQARVFEGLSEEFGAFSFLVSQDGVPRSGDAEVGEPSAEALDSLVPGRNLLQ